MVQKSIVSVIDQYFRRFNSKTLKVSHQPLDDLRVIVVIPIYNEEDLNPTLESLFLNQESYSFSIEVIALVNDSSNEKKEVKELNQKTFIHLKNFANKNNNEKAFLIPIYMDDLDPKHAGVGWARKLGMDLALERFKLIESNGIIVGLDADTVVASNYFIEIDSFFQVSKIQAVSIHFEHPINGNNYTDFHYNQIINYELHLRYYKNALSYVGVPYAFHTIGSAFALTARAYARQGGMNRRKAGEDFYFINKLIKGEKFGEIINTTVKPSPRVSNRVPFGTGRAILEAFQNKKDLTLTYNFKSFEVLKEWVDNILKERYIYNDFPKLIKEYIRFQDWNILHDMFLNNSQSKENYLKLFFTKFDAFWMLKFIHFSRDNHHSNKELIICTNSLLVKSGYEPISSAVQQLNFLRILDKKKGLKAPHKKV
ncbi:MAG: hypothetical protein CL851_05100 [Crocinitomicaceae bacterium]|nr:hypothetical protein [Crocinitomicaceae bacterium]